jgi:hypothetical protein
MILPVLCLLLIGGAAAIAQPPASPTPATPPGDTRFDAADRLAITNLFGGMVRGLDERDLDLLVSTVAPDFWAEYRIPGSPVYKVSGRDNFRSMMAKRFELFENAGIRRRHIISPPFFLEQTPASAHVTIHFLNCTSTHGKDWHPFISAVGEFRAVKRDGAWMFTSQIEVPDVALDLPASTLLPGLEPASK